VPVGERGLEAVLRRARQVDETRIAPALVGGPGAPRHHVAVRVDGVDGIHEGHDAFGREELLDVGAVALAAIADEDLVQAEPHAEGAEVVSGDLGEEELISGIGSVAPEGLGARQLVGGLVEGADHRRRQRLRDVADPEVHQARAGMRFVKGLGPAADLREEVARAEAPEVLVDPGHGASSPWGWGDSTPGVGEVLAAHRGLQ
jgi:hypothetical protein